MSIATDKIAVSCPQCEQQLLVPATSAGKQGRCPNCKHIFPLGASVAAPRIESPAAPQPARWDQEQADDYTLQPLPSTTPLPTSPNPFISPAAQANRANYNHGFGWEHRGWDAGMKGGLTMMAIAAVWFFGGLAFGIIFYYPPIC